MIHHKWTCCFHITNTTVKWHTQNALNITHDTFIIYTWSTYHTHTSHVYKVNTSQWGLRILQRFTLAESFKHVSIPCFPIKFYGSSSCTSNSSISSPRSQISIYNISMNNNNNHINIIQIKYPFLIFQLCHLKCQDIKICMS